MNPAECQDRIEQLLERMEHALDTLKVAAKEAAEAEVAYKVHFSQARLEMRATAGREGRRVTADEVEDWARVDGHERFLAYKITENRLMTGREVLATLRAELEGLRSIAANTRALQAAV